MFDFQNFAAERHLKRAVAEQSFTDTKAQGK